jgi:hypothetical protein
VEADIMAKLKDIEKIGYRVVSEVLKNGPP